MGTGGSASEGVVVVLLLLLPGLAAPVRDGRSAGTVPLPSSFAILSDSGTVADRRVDLAPSDPPPLAAADSPASRDCETEGRSPAEPEAPAAPFPRLGLRDRDLEGERLEEEVDDETERDDGPLWRCSQLGRRWMEAGGRLPPPPLSRSRSRSRLRERERDLLGFLSHPDRRTGDRDLDLERDRERRDPRSRLREEDDSDLLAGRSVVTTLGVVTEEEGASARCWCGC